MTTQVTQAMRMHALEHANKVRLGFAALRKELRQLGFAGSRERCAQILVGESGPHYETIKLDYLLLSCPGFGPSALRDVIWSAGLSPGRSIVRLRQMTNVERAQVARVLRKQAQRKTGKS